MYYSDFNELCSLLEYLKKDKTLSFNEFKKLLEGTYHLLQKDVNNEDWYNLSLSIICHVSEYLPNDPLLNELLIECISASRVFLYRDMLEQKFPNSFKTPSMIENFARAFYTLETNTTLTKKQKKKAKAAAKAQEEAEAAAKAKEEAEAAAKAQEEAEAAAKAKEEAEAAEKKNFWEQAEKEQKEREEAALRRRQQRAAVPQRQVPRQFRMGMMFNR